MKHFSSWILSLAINTVGFFTLNERFLSFSRKYLPNHQDQRTIVCPAVVFQVIMVSMKTSGKFSFQLNLHRTPLVVISIKLQRVVMSASHIVRQNVKKLWKLGLRFNKIKDFHWVLKDFSSRFASTMRRGEWNDS